mmetsp:Transcript_17242/g.43372  ORF Transcript_17242/g.43372 Transcript_17242/m.43372 type:complete len:246 (-) Transcript_17242:814-1551(-)
MPSSTSLRIESVVRVPRGEAVTRRDGEQAGRDGGRALEGHAEAPRAHLALADHPVAVGVADCVDAPVLVRHVRHAVAADRVVRRAVGRAAVLLREAVAGRGAVPQRHVVLPHEGSRRGVERERLRGLRAPQRRRVGPGGDHDTQRRGRPGEPPDRRRDLGGHVGAEVDAPPQRAVLEGVRAHRAVARRQVGRGINGVVRPDDRAARAEAAGRRPLDRPDGLAREQVELVHLANRAAEDGESVSGG